MAKWQRTLDLTPVWSSDDLALISTTIANKLLNMKDIGNKDLDYERNDLCQEFKDLSKDPDINAESFDSLMNELYNWADTALDNMWNGSKLCWIKTLG